jgi:hypothetical protein
MNLMSCKKPPRKIPRRFLIVFEELLHSVPDSIQNVAYPHHRCIGPEIHRGEIAKQYIFHGKIPLQQALYLSGMHYFTISVCGIVELSSDAAIHQFVLTMSIKSSALISIAAVWIIDCKPVKYRFQNFIPCMYPFFAVKSTAGYGIRVLTIIVHRFRNETDSVDIKKIHSQPSLVFHQLKICIKPQSNSLD